MLIKTRNFVTKLKTAIIKSSKASSSPDKEIPVKGMNSESSGASDAHHGFEADFPRQIPVQVQFESLRFGRIPLRVISWVEFDFPARKSRHARQRRHIGVLA